MSAAVYSYLTGLIVAVGFSLGFYLLRPGLGTVAERDLLDAFNWMDGESYKQIATQGYEYAPDSATNVAFFPVYPLLARALMAITGLPVEVALLLVSNISFVAALAILAIYVRDRYPDAPAELRDYTVLTAALFPTGCFFRLAYSESTFLLLVVLAMYGMLRHWPLWSTALIVGLGTATRPVGVALLAPFAIHIIRDCLVDGIVFSKSHQDPSDRGKNREVNSEGEPANSSWAKVAIADCGGRTRFPIRLLLASRSPLRLICARLSLYLTVGCWGAVAFTAYQYYAFEEPFATVKVQRYFGTTTSWKPKAIALATLAPVRSVYDRRSLSFWSKRDPHGIPWFSLQFANPMFFVGAIAMVFLGAVLSLRDYLRRREPRKTVDERSRVVVSRWLSLEEVFLSALAILIPYTTRAYEMKMGSMGRFMAVVFPIYLVIAQLLIRVPGPLRAAMLSLSGCFLSVYTALYAAGYMVF